MLQRYNFSVRLKNRPPLICRVSHYKFVWAFKIDKDKAHREGYDEHSVTGSVEIDSEYPGCPYCGSKQFYICGCGKIICYHGERVVTCPSCGQRGEITTVSEINIKGGGY